MDKGSVVFTYIAAIFLGAGSSFMLATFWLETSSLVLSLSGGAVSSMIGVSMWENFGEAVVFSFILGILAAGIYAFGPEIAILKKGIVPVVIGFCVGKLVVGISKEMSS